MLAEQIEEPRLVPGRMADLQGERIPGKQLEKPGQIIPVFLGVSIGPGALDQESGQPPGRDERFDAELEVVRILMGEALSFMGEDLMELDRKQKIRIVRKLLRPGQGHRCGRRPVERAIDLDDVDITGEIGERMEPRAAPRRVNDPPSPRSSSRPFRNNRTPCAPILGQPVEMSKKEMRLRLLFRRGPFYYNGNGSAHVAIKSARSSLAARNSSGASIERP